MRNASRECKGIIKQKRNEKKPHRIIETQMNERMGKKRYANE